MTQNQILRDVKASLCLAPIEDIEFRVIPVELYANGNDVQIFVCAYLGLVVIFDHLLGWQLEVELLLACKNDVSLQLVDVCDVLVFQID